MIGYQATENDSKRLEFAVQRFGGKTGQAVIEKSIRGSELVGDDGTLERKIDQLGYGVPQLDNDLGKLQKEIHTMVSSFNELQKAQKG